MANIQNSAAWWWQRPPIWEWIAAAGRHLTCTSLSEKILEEFERAEREHRIVFDEEHWLALSEDKRWDENGRGLSY